MPTTNATFESKTVTIKISQPMHDLMKELASRRRIFVGLLYELAAHDLLSRPENYLGENFTIPAVESLRVNNERCHTTISGERCILIQGHQGKHKLLSIE